MTVEQFYKYCKENRITYYEILKSEISRDGCFVGYEKIKPENIYIDHIEEKIEL